MLTKGPGVRLGDLLRQSTADQTFALAVRNNLARVRASAHDPAGATAVYNTLLSHLTRVWGSDHPFALTTRGNITSLLGVGGSLAGAYIMAQELLADVVGP